MVALQPAICEIMFVMHFHGAFLFFMSYQIVVNFLAVGISIHSGGPGRRIKKIQGLALGVAGHYHSLAHQVEGKHRWCSVYLAILLASYLLHHLASVVPSNSQHGRVQSHHCRGFPYVFVLSDHEPACHSMSDDNWPLVEQLTGSLIPSRHEPSEVGRGTDEHRSLTD